MSMSLDGVQNVVLLFSDPIYAGPNTVPSTIIRNLTAVSSDIAYSDHVTENLTVLTSKYTETDNGLLQGLLYVPDLAPDDPCVEYERDYVPDSAVRQANLPATNYNLIAIAPWFNANCTQSYLVSARYDPLRAFIFYVPSNDTSEPPGPDSSVWDLDDDGLWKTENHYPIFAISGAFGEEMMYQLSLYSGNLTSVPFGQNISDLYNPDPDDYVRIWTELTVSTPTGLPNVWVFILAVIGVLLAVITLTCFFMHYVWRRRRKDLRRRVLLGEINLEAMGIKRFTVPLQHVQKFPLFTYNYDPPPAASPTSAAPATALSPTSATSSSNLGSQRILSRRSPSQQQQQQQQQQHLGAGGGGGSSIAAASDVQSPSSSEKEGKSVSFASPTANVAAPATPAVGDLDYQPVCQICLEPFESRVTIIRELSCGHIFHPDCIDEFLSRISSLCPLCKKSMLPRDYCPPITNAMVRRERGVRRLRERVTIEEEDNGGSRGRIQSWGSSIKKHLHTATDHVSHGSSPNTDVVDPRSAIELKSPQNPNAQSDSRRLAASHSEATRRRMRELAGADADETEARARTWKDRARGVFARFS